MKEYIPAVAAVIAGLFAVVSAFIAWRLKVASDERARLTALDKERRDEIKHLYVEIFVLFEQALRQVLNSEPFTLALEVSETNARVQLLAPEEIVTQYAIVSSLLERWSQLHYRATPRRMKVGEETVTVLQAPDPTAEYKEPARLAHEKLHEELHKLIDLMRTEFTG